MPRRPASSRRHRPAAATALALTLVVAGRPAAAQRAIQQTNLVSDVPGLARTLDPQLVNPWGISASPTGPFWVSNAGTGTSTLYNSVGTKLGLVVAIPGPGGPVPAVPTGQVFNNTGSFALAAGGNASFIFASATGTISAWNGASGTNAVTRVNGFAGGASYTGLAIAGTGSDARLYAANFGTGRVDVFDGNFANVGGAGFVDPGLPAGYAPFNVQHVGSAIVVTYAVKDPVTGQDVAGAGNGVVDVYSTGGVLQRRLSNGGALDSPWGVALAPATFGGYGGDLLVGNFGDGRINAFDFATGASLGALVDAAGVPITNSGLWGLTFGNGGQGGDPNVLYFAAGIDDEQHGLFGSLATVPEPSTWVMLGAGLAAVGAAARRRRDPIA